MRISSNKLKKIIKEELSRSEVSGMISSKIEDLDTDRDFKKLVRSIAADVFEDILDEFWKKKGFWKSAVKK